MLIGVPKGTYVCLQCRFRINYLLLPQIRYSLGPGLSNARRQSTAAALLDEPGDDVGQDRDDHILPKKSEKEFAIAANHDGPGKDSTEAQKKPHLSKKAKKRLRRVWKPPPVAELGVSSLGQPAEVLVLKDRERHVPPAANDETERPRASEPRILEALQAENLPLSSEHVKQSLHQISAPYRNQSGVLSVKELAQLRKKISDAFTREQLQAYCFADNRSDPASPASKENASSSKLQTQTVLGTVLAKTTNNKEKTLKFKPSKSDLINYIVKQKWGIAVPEDEQRTMHIPVARQKLEYILNHQQSLLRAYAEEFHAAIDASKEDERIHITGKPPHVYAAHGAVNGLCKDIQISRVRSVSTGANLRNFATSTFLSHLSETCNVMIEWASKQDKGMLKQKDRLTIHHHRTLDEQNALNAERAILLAERDLLLSKKADLHGRKISMWLSEIGMHPDLVLHQLPEESNGLTRQNAWSRWVTPQPPIQIGRNDRKSESPSAREHKRLTSVKRQAVTLGDLLGGEIDSFFSTMPLKKHPTIRESIQKHKVREEISVNLGKILFSETNNDVENVFRIRLIKAKAKLQPKLLTAKWPISTRICPDLPGVPFVLNSLSPFDQMRPTAEVEQMEYKRTYRLRYVPVPSELPPGVEAAAIEIYVLRNGKPGFAVTNYVKSAHAILDEQFHNLLIPSFVVDLEFTRQLNHYFSKPFSGPTAWLAEFEEQIHKSDSDQFPQFIKVVLPGRAVKYNAPQSQGQDATTGLADDVGTTDTSPSTLLTVEDKFKILPLSEFNYMLETSELIHSRSYKTKALCLEHLDLQQMPQGRSRQMLRLGVEPLLESGSSQDGAVQIAMKVLLERAFKIAAQVSDPSIYESPNQTTYLSRRLNTRKAVDLLEKGIQ